MLSSEIVGLVILFCSLLCLGTWPALLRLCSLNITSRHQNLPCNGHTCSGYGQRFAHRFRREHPRNISHVYLDYAIAYFLVSCGSLLGVVVMQNDTMKPTSDTPIPLILTSMLGGSLLSMGNLSLQWATVVFDASLTTVLAIQASLTVVLGTSLNYMLEPTMTPRPSLLVAGVFIFLIAIALASRAQVLYSRHKVDPLSTLQRDTSSILDDEDDDSNMLVVEMERQHRDSMKSSFPVNDSPASDGEKLFLSHGHYNTTQNIEGYKATVDASPPTSGVLTNDPSHFIVLQATSMSYGKPFWGVATAVIGGLCFGFFSPAFNIAVNDPFHWIVDKENSESTPTNAGDNHLSVVRANLWFSLAFLLASVLGNTILLCREHVQLRGAFSLTMVIHKFITHDAIADRILAWTAGIVCALGNVLQFQGGQRVGYATADLVQAYPLVSTLWDVMIFGEFASLQLCSNLGVLLGGMYLSYGIGMVLIAGSSIAT